MESDELPSARPATAGGVVPAGAAAPVALHAVPVPTVVTMRGGPGLVLRSIWFVFIGWWATGILLSVAYLFSLTVVLLPIAFVLFNVVPTVLTLRPRRTHVTTEMRDGVMHVSHGNVPQRPFWMRALWFLLVGWWISAFVIVLGYLLCLTVILIPVGVMVLNRIPEAMTLRRN
jgi:uncharacterized membrane protein YccF (DUF307 family)